ncbi:MAG TPA: hypothetical protein VEY93_14505 [Longimicrobium sp.]|nr:hypothetical protein [Longimicrobium sp.]
MILHVVLGMLAAAHSPGTGAVDTTAVYSAILREVRAQNPSSPVVLATARSAVECMPTCGAFSDVGDAQPDETTHPPALLDALRDAGLINSVCDVPIRTFGCTGLPGQVFVALGPITDDTPEGGARHEGAVWVKVAIIRPIPGDSEAYGYRALVGQDGCGWRVIRTRIEFLI